MTPSDLAKVKAKFPVSGDVEKLSLDMGSAEHTARDDGGELANTNKAEVELVAKNPRPAHVLKRLRQSSKPLMNKLETELFHFLKANYPEDSVIVPQGIRFRLGNGIWYKPDFVIFAGMVWAYEVKGPRAFRGGFENLKVAAGLYPMIRWRLVWKDQNGIWQEQKVLP